MARTNRYANRRNKGIVTPYGQWLYPGQVTTIPDNNITMLGVPYPVLGVSDKGDAKMMLPGMDYLFKGKNVTEYPMMQDGGEVQEEFKYVPSQMILDKMKGFEGFRPRTYWDSVGKKWTVGYGFTDPELVKKYKDTDMTSEEADKYFRDEVNKRISNFLSLTPNYQHLNQNQLDALFDLYYNVGSGTYSQKSPSMQQALREMNWEEVANQMDHGMKQAEGLRLRRLFDQELFRTPYMVPEPEEYAEEEDVVSDNVLPMQTGGKIHIKEKNRGKFTEAAHRAGKSVQAYAAQILANKENYSPALVKRANFARNAASWKHQEGGDVVRKYLEGNYLQPKTVDSVMGAWNDQLAKGWFKGDTIARYVGDNLGVAATAGAAIGAHFGPPQKDITIPKRFFPDKVNPDAGLTYFDTISKDAASKALGVANMIKYGIPGMTKFATGGKLAPNAEIEYGEVALTDGGATKADENTIYHTSMTDENETSRNQVTFTNNVHEDAKINPQLTKLPERENKYTNARRKGIPYVQVGGIVKQVPFYNEFAFKNGTSGKKNTFLFPATVTTGGRITEPIDGTHYPLAEYINQKFLS